MKKLLSLTIMVALTTCLYGQNTTIHVGVNSKFNPRDTTHTFTFLNADIDTCRFKLIKYWGTPIKNDARHILWTSLEIPGIGNEMQVSLTDWLCTDTKKSLFCKPFKNEKDKSKKIRNLKSNQRRTVELTIMNKDSKNIINDKTKTQIVVNLLEKKVQ